MGRLTGRAEAARKHTETFVTELRGSHGFTTDELQAALAAEAERLASRCALDRAGHQAAEVADIPVGHERAVVCRKAQHEHANYMAELRQRHQLTPSEVFLLLSTATLDEASLCVCSERRRNDG